MSAVTLLIRCRELLKPVHWRLAVFCAPAIPIILFVGWLTGHVVPSVISAATALTVGLGATRSLGPRPWNAMVLATMATAATTFIGSMIGDYLWLTLLGLALLSGTTAALALRNQDWWWVALQVATAYVVASYFAGNAEQAATRAALVLAGGILQIVIVAFATRLFPSAAFELQPPAETLRPGPLYDHAVVRAALCPPFTLLLAHQFGLPYNYWATMTALLVLKPDLPATRVRGIARTLGTIAGCILASAAGHVAIGSIPAMIALIGLAVSFTYTFNKANYAVFTFGITLAIVLMIDLANDDPAANALHRIVATLFGGVIALAFAMVGQQRNVDDAPAGRPRSE